MAMRKDVKRHSIVLISFALIQWAFVMAALHGDWWHLDKYGRIIAYCASVFGGGILLMGTIVYMAVFGNDHKNR